MGHGAWGIGHGAWGIGHGKLIIDRWEINYWNNLFPDVERGFGVKDYKLNTFLIVCCYYN